MDRFAALVLGVLVRLRHGDRLLAGVGGGQPRVLVQKDVVEDAELRRVARAGHGARLAGEVEHGRGEDGLDLGLGERLVVALGPGPGARHRQHRGDVRLQQRRQHGVQRGAADRQLPVDPRRDVDPVLA